MKKNKSKFAPIVDLMSDVECGSIWGEQAEEELLKRLEELGKCSPRTLQDLKLHGVAQEIIDSDQVHTKYAGIHEEPPVVAFREKYMPEFDTKLLNFRQVILWIRRTRNEDRRIPGVRFTRRTIQIGRCRLNSVPARIRVYSKGILCELANLTDEMADVYCLDKCMACSAIVFPGSTPFPGPVFATLKSAADPNLSRIVVYARPRASMEAMQSEVEPIRERMGFKNSKPLPLKTVQLAFFMKDIDRHCKPVEWNIQMAQKLGLGREGMSYLEMVINQKGIRPSNLMEWWNERVRFYTPHEHTVDSRAIKSSGDTDWKADWTYTDSRNFMRDARKAVESYHAFYRITQGQLLEGMKRRKSSSLLSDLLSPL